jgi:hypothetical protein
MTAVPACPLKPGMKSIRQPLLIPDLICGVTQHLVRHIRRPEFENALLLGCQFVSFAARQRPQHRLIVLPACPGPPISFPAAHGSRYIEILVGHSEIAIIVQYALVTRVFGKY